MTDTDPDGGTDAGHLTVSVPGATLAYDVRGELAPDVTPLVLIGSPMDASGFATLSSYFSDRVLVTYDPRNTGRSTRDDPTAAVTLDEHVADLHAVLEAVGHGPVDLFASSGGAANALGLVAAHPGDVATLVAHEPPAAGVLPDRDVVRAFCDDLVATYDAQGEGPALAKFIAFAMHRDAVTSDYLDQPAPDPAAFGMSAEDDGSRDDALMANMRGGGTDFVPDAAAIAAAPTRVVVAVGEESATSTTEGEMAGRAAYGVAEHLGLEPTVFPSHHAGFLGGEFGQSGKPAEFAARLREVLSGA